TRKAFKPIRTEIDELKLNLERNKPVIRHTHITKLLTGNTTINDPLIPNINLTGVQINKPWIFCFIIHLHTKGNSYEQVMMHVYSLVQELEADNSLCRIYAIQDEDEHISGIVNFEEVVEMDRLILHMSTILDSKLSMGYTISVSNPHLVHETSVAEGYKEAKAALPYEFLTSEAVIRYGMLSISERKESGPILSYLQKMEDGLREGDREEVQQTITMVVEHLIGNHYTVNYCKSILGDIIVLIRKRIHATGKTSEQVLGFELHESFNQLRNMESFPEWIGPIVQLVIDKTQSGKLKTDPVLQDRINQLIQDNMSNQLSLDLVAEHLNISPNYVSKLFKTVIGSTFTEYVTDMKLKRAMVLLMEDRLSVQDISSQLGYNSTHHFIRLFKDKYGQTPKQYQKMQERRGDTE
ncbi:helix-turn-helix transcriptional regulator, partial [Paenibacillus sp. MCAF20]